jgi:hypothetical protein
MRLFDELDPVGHPGADFFAEWGAKLGWPDEDMLRQMTVTGADSRTECEWDTVIMSHHTGLRDNISPAKAQVEEDTRQGWLVEGRHHLWTVPARLVPKNVVTMRKWKLQVVDGELRLGRVTKFRVTTDDSMRADKVSAADGTTPPQSRNSGMDKDGFAPAQLPSIQTLGEAVAVVRATAAAMGLMASRTVFERVALWALDLSNAYREVQVNRSDHWLQQFIWADGVRLDKRCVFGAAHMPGLFQRVSTFVLAVAI